jgi:hypothetical protein
LLTVVKQQEKDKKMPGQKYLAMEMFFMHYTHSETLFAS